MYVCFKICFFNSRTTMEGGGGGKEVGGGEKLMANQKCILRCTSVFFIHSHPRTFQYMSWIRKKCITVRFIIPCRLPVYVVFDKRLEILKREAAVWSWLEGFGEFGKLSLSNGPISKRTFLFWSDPPKNAALVLHEEKTRRIVQS